jgi:hypothetical protein
MPGKAEKARFCQHNGPRFIVVTWFRLACGNAQFAQFPAMTTIDYSIMPREESLSS